MVELLKWKNNSICQSSSDIRVRFLSFTPSPYTSWEPIYPDCPRCLGAEQGPRDRQVCPPGVPFWWGERAEQKDILTHKGHSGFPAATSGWPSHPKTCLFQVPQLRHEQLDLVTASPWLILFDSPLFQLFDSLDPASNIQQINYCFWLYNNPKFLWGRKYLIKMTRPGHGHSHPAPSQGQDSAHQLLGHLAPRSLLSPDTTLSRVLLSPSACSPRTLTLGFQTSIPKWQLYQLRMAPAYWPLCWLWIITV